MSEKWLTEDMKKLFKTIISLDDQQQCANFFRDLCTIKELNEFAKRWQAALLLDQNKTIREISEQTGLSSATICRISHWIKYGEGGYRSMLNQVNKSNETN